MDGQHLYILTFQVLEGDAPVVTGALETHTHVLYTAMQCRLVSYKASMHIEFCQSATTYNYIVHRLTVIQHHQENINIHHDNPMIYKHARSLHCSIVQKLTPISIT